MAVIETWFKQDLNTAVKPRSFPGEVFNNDSLGNLIGVEVTQDGQAVSLTGSVNGYCILADGETIPVAGTRSGNKASIILPQTAYSVRGIIKISIKITDGQATTTLLQVVGAVDQSVTENMVNPGSVVQDWSQQIAAAMQELHDLENNYVRVDTASQGLTETKKSNGRTNIDAASVADLNDLKSAVTKTDGHFESNGSVYNMIDTTYSGGYIETDGTVTPHNNYTYTDFISIDSEISYTFIARGDSSSFGLVNCYAAAYDSNKNKIEYVNGTTIKDKSFTGASYVRLSWYNSATATIGLFGQSAAFNALIATKKSIPYKASPANNFDLSLNSTPVTSWQRNSTLFTGHTVKAINRIGNIGGAPENSIAGFVNAINAGFDILLVDLLWTADGVPVCCHDNDISRVARTNNGGTISGVSISNTQYNTLYADYDFGIVKGEQYKGTKILSFEDFLKFVKHMNVYVYVEFKNFSSANYSVQDTVKMVYQYGLGDRVAWHGGMAVSRIIHNNYPNATIAYYMASGAASDTEINNAISLNGDNNEVFLFGWDTTTFTTEQMNTLIANNIAFECGTLNTEADIIDYIASNPYCRGIESDRVVASRALIKKYIDY